MIKNGFVLLLFGALAWYFLVPGSAQVPAGKILWDTNATKALSPAVMAGVSRPTVIVFTATWCGPCQEMKSDTWPDPGVADAMKHYRAVWADVDHHGELARQFTVQSIPTVIVVDRFGNEVARQAGYVAPEQMIAWLVD